MTKPTIGFIGLGLMGAAMVGRLQDKGYSLTVLGNRSRTAVDAAVARGAGEAQTAAALAAVSDIVMICVDTTASVESRIYGKDGVLDGLKPDTIVIDFGTSLPASSLKIGEEVAKKQGFFLDAPLGRTPSHAKDGKLNIMCGGAPEAYERIKPVLDDLGENIFHVGPLGSGHKLKLINNFFAMTTACAMSEAFAMADKAGLPRQGLYDVMSAGPLRSGMMDFVKNYATDGQIDLAFSVRNANKDVGYYRQMAEELGVMSRMAGSASATLAEAVDQDFGDHMVPEMVDFLSRKFSDA
ncbi:NAD(P)-dependent oxidoreductase [Pseudoruegeria sp. SK021]|uniref:NAD(P)-dependent oxidoreductase n=1 Tax=Pseudoruegeria sp. SK021 TaxID=1933035 RepID=UPI000A24C4C5|nr:NAD(P)-dependent oxidoreductase [Pseudoruegeria sp. SK021]OSP55986.1 6-phosphogluconate dehydrogenase [Pseudoruegeria sp. SK021]